MYIIPFFVVLLFHDTIYGLPLTEIQFLNNTDCPRIVSREEWKARKPLSEEQQKRKPAPYVVVHHGGIRQHCYDEETCSKIVRSYQNYHIDDKGWFDIGYSFVIGEDGNVYEGRGWEKVGAHAPGYNFHSIGICIIGDFSDFLPNAAALESLHSLISCGVSLGKISNDYSLIGHRQARNTLCPGDMFYKYVTNLPHWTPSPTPLYIETSTAKVPIAPGGNEIEIDTVVNNSSHLRR